MRITAEGQQLMPPEMTANAPPHSYRHQPVALQKHSLTQGGEVWMRAVKCCKECTMFVLGHPMVRNEVVAWIPWPTTRDTYDLQIEHSALCGGGSACICGAVDRA